MARSLSGLLDFPALANTFRCKMTRVTTEQLRKDIGALSERALREPVMITKRGRDHLVMLSAEEFARLKRHERRVASAADLPEEWLDAVAEAKVPDEFAYLDAELK